MTKQFLRGAVLILLSAAVFSSCKKTHPLNAYPDNVRLTNFTKTTTSSGGGNTLYETYRFEYDVFNRVSQIVHTKNDGSSNVVSALTYRNDVIYDTMRYVNISTVIEVDSFITDKSGKITVTYDPIATTTYDYSGNLLTRKTFSNNNYYTYTSYNSNFIKSTSSIDAVNNASYTYYTDKFNRAGDYMQLNSFLRYGFNFFQNNNLVWKIIKPYSTTNVEYVIDAENKITRTTAVTADTAGVLTTEVYDLQYEKYK